MPDDTLNALWCRCIAEELARGGVAHAVLCPGSRNSPLLFALADVFSGRCHEHLDERAAAFVALGLARATGAPAVVCVTSGTAVANCAPALAEARALAIPLIVLAADRPWELHGCGAPQAMPQRDALRAFAGRQLDLGEPVADDAVLRRLRATISRAAQAGQGPLAIDVPLRDPLVAPGAAEWSAPGLTATALHGRGSRPFTVLAGAGDPLPLLDFLKPGRRGLIVAGAQCAHLAAEIRTLAQVTGFPLLTDAPSGVRDANAIATADALLTGAFATAQPELVIAVGQPPLARTTWEWLGRQECPLLLIENGGADDHDRDFTARAWAALHRPSPAAWRALGAACHDGDAAWAQRWRAGDHAARAGLVAAMVDEPWGEVLAAHLAINHPAFPALHLASSMPVRHANLHLLRLPAAVHSNRGLNGIDGTLATFLGTSVNRPGLLLCGDLAFLHDLSALAAVPLWRRAAAAGDPGAQTLCAHLAHSAIVVLANDGGAIFDFLPVAGVPGYRRWVHLAHGLELQHAAAQFGLSYRTVSARAELIGALDAAAHGGGPTLIECAVADGAVVERHRALIRGMAATAT